MPEAIAQLPPRAASTEALLAVRNAVKLGGSLAATWGVALAVRVLLPRYLGPELFGSLTFADAFASVAFVPLSLGLELYIRKEVAVRPAHASDFAGGVLALRVALSAVLFLAIALVMAATDRPAAVRTVVYLFAGGQFFAYLNSSLAALLHARGRVDGLSVVSVLAKVAWAAGVALALGAGWGITGVALCFLLSEVLKSAALVHLTRQALRLELHVDLRATWGVLVASLPIYLSALAQTAYAKIDVNVLAFTVDEPAVVGWYGAASSLAGLTLVITPVIGWVLTPFLSRELARSPAAFDGALRRSVQVVLAFAIPTSLMLSLGSDLWIRLMFGAQFSPAAAPLRLLAPTFVLTYVATLTAICLVLLGRGWAVTRISLLGMALNLALNVSLAYLGLAWWGPPGAALGCAAAMVLTEAVTVGLLVRAIGPRAFDLTSLRSIGNSLLASAAAVLVHSLTGGLGDARLALDLAVYLVIVVATGALPIQQFAQFTHAALRHRHEDT